MLGDTDDVLAIEHEIRIDYSLLSLCLITICLFTYIIVRVIQTIKCSDLIFLSMLITLQLCLIAEVAYITNGIIQDYRQRKKKIEEINHAFYCKTIIFDTLPAMLLAVATTLNINKWCYYNLRTRAYKHKDEFTRTKNELTRHVSILNFVTGLSMICIVAPYCFFYGRGCDA